MIRVVVDTNILVSFAIRPNENFEQMFNFLARQGITLISDDTVSSLYFLGVLWEDRYGAIPIIMKRDSIFYRLFQQSPSLLFDLLENPPDNATEYRFDSVAVKEPKFEIDGVFLPPDNDSSGVIYFC